MTAGALAGGLVLASALALVRAGATRRGRHDSLRPTQEAPASVPGWFERHLSSAGIELPVQRAWLGWLWGAPTVTAVGCWMGGIGLGLLLAGTWMLAPLTLSKLLAGRVEARREAAVPSVLDAIARSLRSGASLAQALAEAADEPGPLSGELRSVVTEAGRGAGVVNALEGWGERSAGAGVRMAVAALCLGAEMGGANARTVEGVAATVRQRLAVAGEARALSAQARISALVIALAPVGFCAIAAATDPAIARFLFATPLGWAFLIVGVGLDALGAVWMNRMART